MHPDEISGAILETAIAIHRELGPGLLESVYEAILAFELREQGFRVRRQQAVRLIYADIVFDEAFRADLIVEDTVVVEVKAIARLDPSHPRQLLGYLRLLDHPLGLVINFGQARLLSGVRRIVNNLPPFSRSRVRINQGQGLKRAMRPSSNAVALPRAPASPREHCSGHD